MLVLLGLPKSKHRGPIVKTTSVPVSHNYRTSNDQLLLTYGGGSLNVDSFEEGITYTTRSKTNRHRSNWCWHHKIHTTYSGSPATRLRTDHFPVGQPGNNNYYLDASHHTTSSGAHSSAVTTAKAAFPTQGFGPSFLSTNAEAYINQAYADLKPDLTEMSLPNFLLEVDQLKTLIPSWKKVVKAARENWRYITQGKKRLLVKNVAGHHLAWKFGADPLVGDVQATIAALTSISNSIELWNKYAGTIFHKSKHMLESEEIVSGKSTYTAETQTSWKGTMKRTVSAHIVYRSLPILAINELDLRIRAYLDAFGVELNPRILWDAARFTFIVDWFVSVGAFLERFKIDALELPIGLVDSYLQYKEEFRCESDTVICYGRSDFTAWPRSGGWITTETSFQRMPIFPTTNVLTALHWKTPNASKAVLGLSLAAVLGIKR